MPVEVELVHAEPGRRVVLARLCEAGGISATALGEGSDAEEAEDRARARLGAPTPAPTPEATPAAAKTAASPTRTAVRPQPAPATVTLPAPAAPAPASEQPPATAKPSLQPSFELSSPGLTTSHNSSVSGAADGPPMEPPPDPEDWSSELANLDLQLKRLGWSREQESIYLLRAFGHGSRSRLTTYGDLLAYLRALEGFAPGEDPASCSVPLKRSELLLQSDQLLGQLGWDAARGRELLETQFQRSSRQQLSDSQLLAFNMLLEGELLALPATGSALSSASSAG